MADEPQAVKRKKKPKRLAPQQLHVTLTEGPLIEGMTIEFDCDINDMPETVVNVLNRANFIGIEGRDEATVGFHVRQEPECE